MLDTNSKKRLEGLQGKIFSFKSTSPEISISITVHEEGFLFSPVVNGDVDAEVSGPAAELSKLLFAKDKNTIIRNSKISLTGDASSLQELQTIIVELDIDWEYRLSKIIGDLPTQALSESLDSLKSFLDSSTTSLTNDIDEYVHEEAKIIPTTLELNNFYHRIDALRLRLDRNRARLTKIAL